MKKRSVGLLLIAVAGAAMISLGQGTPGEKAGVNGRVSEMQNQLSEMQARIQSLEGRLKSLESTVEEMKRPQLQPLTSPGAISPWPKAPASTSESPKIWGEREINGWTYYIVPCGEQSH